MIQKRVECKLGNLHWKVVGSKFRKCNINLVSIDFNKEDKVILNFHSPQEANLFVNSKVKDIVANWLAYESGRSCKKPPCRTFYKRY